MNIGAGGDMVTCVYGSRRHWQSSAICFGINGERRLKKFTLHLDVKILSNLRLRSTSRILLSMEKKRHFYKTSSSKALKQVLSPNLKGPVVFSPKIPAETLQSALANETQLLGSSPNGKYNKTVLDNGLIVAVKQLEPFENVSIEAQSQSVEKTIQQELEILASLRHRNLMSLRAYIHQSRRYYLITDYAPTDSLEDVMRRPSNVMLDSRFEPRLADYGLAMIIPNVFRAASGYSAPECSQNDGYTDKSDVFSFGVILGVLLTSKDPLDPFSGEANVENNGNGEENYKSISMKA
ncbi:inactive leucine-rich repeat receptor-like protein kinase CORYNE [Olea europaea var. sylvestris]|uniref:inactive leucine-rich repeat receptor-like protein kinase CORYNE n=1 Tax=Olea europaea var. sylvestris TaxID=158386 RepID=UPI000C1CE6AF|nr:inactive leucine-rich repeat receptor-like protein kinase CORYNE [Olea europaea var. sylvestris]